MIEQYPHSIEITVKTTPSQDGDGNYVSGTNAVYTFDCRAEVNGTGRKIAGKDGTLTDYTFDVFMPLTSTVIPEGSKFTLNSVTKGTVKRSRNGQLNSRLWL